MVNSLKPKDFGIVSRLRNSLIANMLSRTIYVEKLGTGITRIRKTMRESGLSEPEFNYNHSFFATLYDKTNLTLSRSGGVTTVAERREWIVNYLVKNGNISTKQYVKAVKVSLRTAQRDLTALQSEGLIKFVGSPKTGHYELA